jgi:hypothetical protein
MEPAVADAAPPLCKTTLAIFKLMLIQSALSGDSNVRPGLAAPDSVGNLNLQVAFGHRHAASASASGPGPPRGGHWQCH